MRTLLYSVSLCLLVLLNGSTFAQVGEPPIKQGEQLRISLTGVPGPDSASMGAQQFVVDNDGTIHLMHIGGHRVGGLTPSQVARNIESAYKSARIYTRPVVNVSRVTDVTSRSVASVSGNVKASGTVILRPGMTIIEAISEKGGFDDFANPSKVRLVRNQKTTVYDLKNVSQNPQNNVVLEPGDIIIVPQKGTLPFLGGGN